MQVATYTGIYSEQKWTYEYTSAAFSLVTFHRRVQWPSFLIILAHSGASQSSWLTHPVFCVFLLLSLSPKCSHSSFSSHISRYLFFISNWTAQHHMH